MMARLRAPFQPVFVDRKAAAEMLMISVDTFETWLRAGFIPGPTISRGQIVRWHWPTLEEHLLGLNVSAQPAHSDPFMANIAEVFGKGRRRRGKQTG